MLFSRLMIILAMAMLLFVSCASQVDKQKSVQTSGASSTASTTVIPASSRKNLVVIITSFLSFLKSKFGNLLRALNPLKSRRFVRSRAGNGGSLDEGNLMWDGIAVSEKEKESILYVKAMNDLQFNKKQGNDTVSFKGKLDPALSKSRWLEEVTDVEILRFLRRDKGDREVCLKSTQSHAKWRQTKYGADNIAREGNRQFGNSPLNREIFWLGLSKDNCAVLVVRTQAHDGRDYNEDSKLFTAFITWILEQGREKYQIGTERQVCIILDRGTFIRGGQPMPYKLDMGVIPRLLELFRTIYATIYSNYPLLLQNAKVVPVSTFFSLCYRVTSKAMDKETRDRFSMVKEKYIVRDLHNQVSPSQLPKHLLGTSHMYGPHDMREEDRIKAESEQKIPT